MTTQREREMVLNAMRRRRAHGGGLLHIHHRPLRRPDTAETIHADALEIIIRDGPHMCLPMVRVQHAG